MQQILQLKLLPSEAGSSSVIRDYCARAAAIAPERIKGFHILKSSLDARSRQVWILLKLRVFVDEPFHQREIIKTHFPDVSKASKKVVIVGAGPAGLFAALSLVSAGIRPILLERGKEVRARRRDLAILNKEGIINPESNYCFGEGGAGTYSDGKLYTRSTKRGDVNLILNRLVQFGAAENILYDAHPHIGTNKLPQIISSMRETLLACGAEFHFQKKMVDWVSDREGITRVLTSDQDQVEADALILATGHSARDIFQLLKQKNIQIEFKDFALGVRVEHPQQLIDCIQYAHAPGLIKSWSKDPFLPPASYSLVQQVDGKGVFSFCMCPGGIIAPASTSEGELVVNGWSPSKRNNPYANSGIVVTVNKKNTAAFGMDEALSGMYFQQAIERKAFEAGGGKFAAPAQRMEDFVNHVLSSSLPDCSYLPGIHAARLRDILPPFVHEGLRQAFLAFGKKMKGYYTNDAVVVATESRTSSPVRIPRHPEHLHHPQIRNLFPCGEGAGYAGGIVSAAMDGDRVAGQVVRFLTGSIPESLSID